MNEGAFLVGILRSTTHLGYLILPYYCRREESFLTVVSLFSADEISDEANETPHIKLLHELARSLDVNEIVRRFSKTKQSPSIFFKTADKKIIDKMLMPFVSKQTAKIIELFLENDIPVYHGDIWPHLYEESRIKILKSPPEVKLFFKRGEEGTTYTFEAWIKETKISLQNPNNIIVSNEPCYLYSKNRLIRFDDKINGKLLSPFLKKVNIQIPQRIEKTYFESFIKKIVNLSNIEAEGFQIIDLDVKPKVVLSLEQDFQGLPGFVVSFDYNDRKILCDNPQQSYTTLITDENGFVFKRFRRDSEWENNKRKILKGLGLQQYASFFRLGNESRYIKDFLPFLIENKAALKEEGFIIEQKETNPWNFDKPYLRIKNQMQNDWFDLFIMINLGDISLPFVALKNHILQNENIYFLPNGEKFLIPDSWFEKYREMFIHGREHATALRFSKHHFGTLKQFQLTEIEALEKEIERIDLWQKPVLNNAELRPYQEYGSFWIRNLSRQNLGGILADDMGLGKTIQVIAVLTAFFEGSKKQKIDQNKNEITDNQQLNYQLDLFSEPPVVQESHIEVESATTSRLPALLVMPTSLIHNWKNEINRFAPWMKTLIYSGTQRKMNKKILKSYQLILTTYGTLRNDIDLLKTFAFSYVIMDESQQIKNPESKTSRAAFELRADFRFGLTGTPLENHLTDIWSQMHFLNPGMLGTLSEFNRYYAVPISKNPLAPERERLIEIIKPFILRRTKAQVAPELPPMTETVVYCEMGDEQRKLYEEEKSRMRNALLESLEDENLGAGNAVMVLKALMTLRQFANHPCLADPSLESESGKFEMITDTLQTVISENHKVLAFSSFLGHLKLLEDYCIQHNIGYVKLIGATLKREAVIDSFRNNDQVKVFLISLKAGGLGLNLTEAGYVFMLDPWWNPAAELQAINRAHRIGQDKKVFVYRFISKDTVEEKILKLQDKKRALAESFIVEDQFIRGLSKEEILKLICE
ncbi:MAG: SNF2-related protein [Bacteroidales bacterium]|nr:SNF2-related protein [Bacteroidales bacterium]